MKIRAATIEDIPAIQDLAYAIWPDAYSKIISPEQLAYMLQIIYSQESLLLQMQRGNNFIILSDETGAPVGFAAYVLKVDETPITFRLQKLYVLQSLHGKGFGKLLLDYVIEKVKSEGGGKLDLTVNRQNPAQYFYHTMGFEILREEDTDIGNGFFMNDYVMEKNL